jgi:hypothetical protein
VVPEFPKELVQLDPGDVSLVDEEHAQAVLLVLLVSEQGFDLEGSEQIQENRLFPEPT